MNHRIFERKLRSRVPPGACLPECHLNLYSTTCLFTAGSAVKPFVLLLGWSAFKDRDAPPHMTYLLRLCGSTCLHPSRLVCCACVVLWNLFLIFKHSQLEVKQTSLCSSQRLNSNQFIPWPQISQDYPLNLSILISGGKENNSDCLSNGEWSGKSSNLKSPAAT